MLAFTPDGSLVLVEPDGVEVHSGDPAGGRWSRFRADGRARGLAAFDEEVWLVGESASGPLLHRYATGGRHLGEATRLGGAGRLLPVAGGTPAAVWLGDPALELRDDMGALVSTPIEPRPDFALPLAARRWLALRDGRLFLHEPSGEQPLTEVAGDLTGARVIDGSSLFDGAALALVVEREGVGHLLVLKAQSGVVQQRVRVDGVTAATFAHRRGHALLLVGDRRVVVVDLHFGKLLGGWEDSAPITGLAIDGAARHLAIRRGDELAIFVYREIFGSPGAPRPSRVEPWPPPEETKPETGDRQPETGNGKVPEVSNFRLPVAGLRSPVSRVEEEAPREPIEVPPLVALEPRTERASMAEDARRVLGLQLKLAGAWCGRALSEAWDCGRLAAGAGDRHPFESEAAAILAPRGGRAAAELAQAEKSVRELEGQLAEEPGAAKAPLAELAAEFGLSELASDILLVVAAPSLWGDLGRLYRILGGEQPTDARLVARILGPRAGEHEIARELEDDRPLRRYGLLSGEPALAVDAIVVRRLRGDDLERSPDDAASLHPAELTVDDIAAPRQVVQEIVSALARPAKSGPLRLVLTGRPGSGRRSLLAALARLAHRPLGLIDAGLLTPGERLPDELRRALHRTRLRGWLPCVSGLDAAEGEAPGVWARLREVLRAHPGPIVLRARPDAPLPLASGFLSHELPPLSDRERAAFWRQALEKRGLDPQAGDRLAGKFFVGPGVIVRAIDEVAAGGVVDGVGELELEVALRRGRDARLGGAAARVARLASWSKVVLPAEMLDSLRELIGRVRHRRTLMAAWGLEDLAPERGLIVLFQGAPGTGKSMAAGLVARELGFDLYRVEVARILGRSPAEAERIVAPLFEVAEEGQVVLLVEDIDVLLAQRGEPGARALLAHLDSFGGIAIVTGRSGVVTDAAFRRRLSQRLSFPFPDEELREQLWRVHLPRELATDKELDLASLAHKHTVSGGTIRNAVLRATYLAAQEQVALTRTHLERAVGLEQRETGKLVEQTGE